MKAKDGYSIWFVPQGKDFTKFKNLINNISKENNSPLFDPHATLLPNVKLPLKEIESKVQKLAQQISSFKISLTSIDTTTSFFRSLFLNIELTPTLIQAHQTATEVFDLDSNIEYKPHFSLLYGEQKQSIKDQTIKTHKIKNLVPTSFNVEKIYVYATNLDYPRWEKVNSFKLT